MPLGDIDLLRRLGAEAVGAWQHHAERFHLAFGRDNGAAGDAAAVVDVGLGFDFNILEAHFLPRLRFAAIRMRSAFSLMKPSASFWL